MIGIKSFTAWIDDKANESLAVYENKLKLLRGDLIQWGLSDDDAELVIKQNKDKINDLIKAKVSNDNIIQQLNLAEKLNSKIDI